LASVGVVSNETAKSVGLKRPTVAFELRFRELVARSKHALTYTPIRKFPPIQLDLSVTVAEDMAWGKVEQTVLQAGTDLLRNIELFDVYHHGDGKKSFGFHLEFRSDEKSLEMSEAETLHKRIVEKLENELGARLR